MARGSAPRDALVLHCECRRPATFERGMIKWSFALLILGAAALDAFWVMPAQREARARARAVEPYVRIDPVEAHAPLAPALAEDDAGELRVIDVKLLTPRQAGQ